MSAMTFSSSIDLADSGALAARLRAKFGPLAVVLGIHVVMGYLVYSGTLNRMVDIAIPKVVTVNFVAPPSPAPAPPVPKTVPVVKLPPPVVVPQVPMVQIAVQNTITVPQVAAAVAEKAPVAPPQVVAVASATPAPPAPGPKTITSGVEYIQAPQPVYPAMSKRMGEQGKVVLRILINEKGLPDQVLVQTSSGSTRLDEAGRQAALRALFKPHMEDGRAVAVYVIVPLNFQLAS